MTAAVSDSGQGVSSGLEIMTKNFMASTSRCRVKSDIQKELNLDGPIKPRIEEAPLYEKKVERRRVFNKIDFVCINKIFN
ncbi:hypothetical protein TNIN_108111 [Trichonephila inaurata madagascariensis]|uniref:Uncharacterized protein n=1 Tax=Trichonephila inaurata madagascariensis TaxID=2747483 RepID=A0A8X7BPL5_9ARAC|nr:hypothetical protein TNIN_108111 [Trichonephila inaurata madagascariensis]